MLTGTMGGVSGGTVAKATVAVWLRPVFLGLRNLDSIGEIGMSIVFLTEENTWRFEGVLRILLVVFGARGESFLLLTLSTLRRSLGGDTFVLGFGEASLLRIIGLELTYLCLFPRNVTGEGYSTSLGSGEFNLAGAWVLVGFLMADTFFCLEGLPRLTLMGIGEGEFDLRRVCITNGEESSFCVAGGFGGLLIITTLAGEEVAFLLTPLFNSCLGLSTGAAEGLASRIGRGEVSGVILWFPLFCFVGFRPLWLMVLLRPFPGERRGVGGVRNMPGEKWSSGMIGERTGLVRGVLNR